MAWEPGKPAPAKGHADRTDYNVWRWGTTSKGGAKPIPGQTHPDRPEFEAFRKDYSKNKAKAKSAEQAAGNKAVKERVEAAKTARASKTMELERKKAAAITMSPLSETLHPNAVTHDEIHATTLHNVADELDRHAGGGNEDAENAIYAGREALTKHQIANQNGYAKLAGTYASTAASYFSAAHAILDRAAGPGGIPKKTRPNGETYTLSDLALGAARDYKAKYPNSAEGVKEPTAVKIPALSNFLESKKAKIDKVPWQQRPGKNIFIMRQRQEAAKEKWGWDPEKIKESTPGSEVSISDLPAEERTLYRKVNPVRLSEADVSEKTSADTQEAAKTLAGKKNAEALAGAKVYLKNGTPTYKKIHQEQVLDAIKGAHTVFAGVEKKINEGQLHPDTDPVSRLPRHIKDTLGPVGIDHALQMYHARVSPKPEAEPVDEPTNEDHGSDPTLSSQAQAAFEEVSGSESRSRGGRSGSADAFNAGRGQ